jgi:hypothetical protein
MSEHAEDDSHDSRSASLALPTGLSGWSSHLLIRGLWVRVPRAHRPSPISFAVLAALAAAFLAATLQPAAAAPAEGTVVAPAVPEPGARPALRPIIATPAKAQAAVKDHGLLVCPLPATYDPDSNAP